MAGRRQNALGTVEIADSVIATIAGLAATKAYGLVGMATRNVQDGLAELLRLEQYDRGVKVHLDDDKIGIDLYIMVEYGVKISEVAHNVMEQVKYAVENQCGFEVTRVNVHVEGVRVGRGLSKK